MPAQVAFAKEASSQDILGQTSLAVSQPRGVTAVPQVGENSAFSLVANQGGGRESANFSEVISQTLSSGVEVHPGVNSRPGGRAGHELMVGNSVSQCVLNWCNRLVDGQIFLISFFNYTLRIS